MYFVPPTPPRPSLASEGGGIGGGRKDNSPLPLGEGWVRVLSLSAWLGLDGLASASPHKAA